MSKVTGPTLKNIFEQSALNRFYVQQKAEKRKKKECHKGKGEFCQSKPSQCLRLQL